MNAKQANIKTETEAKLNGKDLHGFKWCYCENGMHVFSRRVENHSSRFYGQYETIHATEGDLTDGNIEFFTKNGISRI